jgi:hypothetical protein
MAHNIGQTGHQYLGIFKLLAETWDYSNTRLNYEKKGIEPILESSSSLTTAS